MPQDVSYPSEFALLSITRRINSTLWFLEYLSLHYDGKCTSEMQSVCVRVETEV